MGMSVGIGFEPAKPTFSMEMDGVSFSLNELRNIGEEKISQMQAVNAKEAKTFKSAGWVNGFVAMASLAIGAEFGGLLKVDGPVGGFLMLAGAAGVGTIVSSIKNYCCNRKADQCDQAIVLMNGNMNLARCNGTEEKLVKKGFFTKHVKPSEVSYQPV